MSEKKILGYVFLIILLTVVLITANYSMLTEHTQADTAEHVLLIDAGHGGMDGGAVAGDGTLEKDINLAIAKELGALAEEYGWQVVYTRENDEWLCDTEEGSIRSRKTADLRARRSMVIEKEPDLTVSIHLNSFKEDQSVSGAQVFYPDSGGEEQILQQCKQLACVIQTQLNNISDIGKDRTAQVKDKVFIFKEIVSPIVIVECGFLSNPDEAYKLKTTEYQRETAQGIMAGITEFTGFEKAEPVEIIDSLR